MNRPGDAVTYPTFECTSIWPSPAGLGPTVSLAGRHLNAEEQVAILIYVRPTAGTTWTARGVRVRFESDGVRYEAVSRFSSVSFHLDSASDLCDRKTGWFDDNIPVDSRVPDLLGPTARVTRS